MPESLIACLAGDRAPTVREVEELASRIWAEGLAERSAFAWGELQPSAHERVLALRSAVLALNGSEEK